MLFSIYLRRLTTVKRLGFANCLRIVRQRHKTYRFNKTWRKNRAAHGHDWQAIAGELGCTPSFERFFSQQRMRTLPVIDPLLGCISDVDYIRMADEYTRHEFSLLGSEKRSFQQMPWHEDIRLSGQQASADILFDHGSWYTDMPIETGMTQELTKDIKVPWELSRLQHLPVLGRAYATTQDERYLVTFKEHIADWMSHNRFLQGVNWVCPMEVALRAVSLVVASTYFGRSSLLDDDFWLAYVTTLYDHMIYLEHNWELYDLRTSNHYIADLVGYLYLCWFFHDTPHITKRRDWCHEQLLAELDKQINPDGSSYEQSTAYHGLVTELFYHHRLVAKQLQLLIPAKADQKLAAMCDYLRWCTPDKGQLITIGDNDSGQVTVAGLPKFLLETNEPDRIRVSSAQQYNNLGIRHYQNAGLSLIKTKTWHVSLRHTVYQKHEPTSHMHNDATSVTIACNGVPFVVDPGTYVYTASSYWRNLFRSVQSHSGIYLARERLCRQSSDQSSLQWTVKDSAVTVCDLIEPIEQVTLDEKIFLLRRKPVAMPAQENITGAAPYVMCTTHDDYVGYGYKPARQVTLDELSATVLIKDQVDRVDSQQRSVVATSRADQQNQSLYVCAQFLLHPDVLITRKQSMQGSCWLLTAAGITLELASDQLIYEPVSAWYSPAYGVKVATHKLFAQQDLAACTNIPWQMTIKLV